MPSGSPFEEALRRPSGGLRGGLEGGLSAGIQEGDHKHASSRHPDASRKPRGMPRRPEGGIKDATQADEMLIQRCQISIRGFEDASGDA
jgi:hypothetical protein